VTLLQLRRSIRAVMEAASFAVARVRARPSRGLVTALGISLTIASVFVTLASPTIAGDATLRRLLEEVPAGERSITVAISVNSLSFDQVAGVDQKAHHQLRAPGLGPVRGEVVYRTLATTDGVDFRLAGIDDLANTVTLKEGRLPATCVPTRCEVVVANSNAVLNTSPTVGVVVVGRVTFSDTTLLAGFYQSGSKEVLLLGDGVGAVGAIAPLSLIGRSIGWVASIDPKTLRLSDINPVLQAGRATVETFALSGVSVTLPSDALKTARSRSSTASSRVALAAAQGVVLLVAFVLLSAAAARREHLAARRLLRQRGASRLTLNVFTAVEAAWPAIVGLSVGIVGGAVATVVMAKNWHLSPGDIVRHVLQTGVWRVGAATFVLLAATACVLAYGAQDSTSVGTTSPWWEPTAIDGLGVAAFVAGALAMSRGAATPSALATSGDSLVASLPLLASVVVAWLAVRLVPPVVSAFIRPIRRRAPLLRTALGEVARRPKLSLVTAGFLAAATMLAVFSVGYRTTLHAGAHDQAAFAVPYDITVSEGPALIRPNAVTPAGGWTQIAPTARSTEVLRRGVAVRNRSLANDTVTMLGIDPSTITSLRGWRSDFGPPLNELPTLIRAPHPVQSIGTAIPEGTTALAIQASGDTSITAITAVIARRDGVWHEEEATSATEPSGRLRVSLTSEDSGGRLIGFRLSQPGYASDRVQHHVGEGTSFTEFFTADVMLESVQALQASGAKESATPLPIDWNLLRADGAKLTSRAGGLDVALRLQGTSALVVPPASPDMETIPAIVDPSTAAAATNGLVSISVVNNARRVLRVTGVATRFPGAPSRFAIVDRSLAQPSLDLINPGLGTSTEAWIAVDHVDEANLARTLRSPPFTDLLVRRRSANEQRLNSDPLSLFALGLFGAAALITGILAAAALYLSTLADATAQAPLHRALAADGVTGRSLSRMVLLSALATATTAIALGAIAATVLLRLVSRIIAVTATATVAVPPLVASLPRSGLLVALAIVTVPCILAAAAAARSAQRVSASDLLREFG
jgi:hypothetical protein